VAAGKPSSEDTIQTIYMNEIFGFVILFGGIGSKRPWGKLEIPDSDTLKNYKSLALDHFRHQFPRRS
jgi:hypothetical protein